MFALEDWAAVEKYHADLAHFKRATAWMEELSTKYPGAFFQHTRLDEWSVFVPTPGYAVPILVDGGTNPAWKWQDAYTLLGLFYAPYVSYPTRP